MYARWTPLVLLLLAGLSGCLDDSSDDPTDAGEQSAGYTPAPFVEYALPDLISDLNLIQTQDPNATTGMWVEDGIAYLSGGSGLRIHDVNDPQDPRVLATEVEGTTGTRDVDILHHPDGNTYAVLAHGGSKITLVDVTDPTLPVVVATVTDIGPAHNIAVVPNSTLVYNSRSISEHAPSPPGTTGQIDIVDFADPTAPETSVFAFPAVATGAAGAPKPVLATTCHDITFTESKQRAYCAGVTETHVWDISDPAAPEIIQVILNPVNNIHHGAWGARDGDLLIIGDEFAGAAAGPNCVDPAPNPYGALWFWDISDLAAPVPVGYYQITYNSAQEGNPSLCTTHFGSFVEDRDLFVLAWYTAGVGVVDFSDPANPVEVAHYRGDGTNAWDAWYYNGHVFTGDTGRGMEILQLV